MDTSTAAGRALVTTDTLGRRVAARRFRTLHEKRQIVQASLQPGSSVAEVARRHGLNANLLFAWRRLLAQGLLGGHTRRSGQTRADKDVAGTHFASTGIHGASACSGVH